MEIKGFSSDEKRPLIPLPVARHAPATMVGSRRSKMWTYETELYLLCRLKCGDDTMLLERSCGVYR